MADSNLDYTKFASNPHGQITEPLDYSDVYAPTAKTYHGITLVVNGRVMGRVQNWNAAGAYTRVATKVYELNNRQYGRPVDLVPGRSEGFNVTASLGELWGAEAEIQTGSSTRYIDLTSQTTPFVAQEYWFRGADIYEVWTYTGGWITDATEQDYSVDGDTRVLRNFNFSYVARFPTASS